MIYTPSLTHLVKTRGDKHDAKELRALRRIARAAACLVLTSHRRNDYVKLTWNLEHAVAVFQVLTEDKPE